MDQVTRRNPNEISTGIQVTSAAGRDQAFRDLSTMDHTCFFKLRQRLVKQGRADTYLAATDKMRVSIKVYAASGENALHAHPYEDHMFMILQGRAKFLNDKNETVILGKHQGALIPRGVLYSFIAEGDEPLVMLRVGSYSDKIEGKVARTTKSGEKIDGYSKENKTREIIWLDEYFE